MREGETQKGKIKAGEEGREEARWGIKGRKGNISILQQAREFRMKPLSVLLILSLAVPGCAVSCLVLCFGVV